MSPVADDPTTKPCPGKGWPHGSTMQHHMNCACAGTGRVPMDTGELLEALRTRCAGVRPGGYPILSPVIPDDADPDEIAWIVTVRLNSAWIPFDRKAATPDEALRAALQEVTP